MVLLGIAVCKWTKIVSFEIWKLCDMFNVEICLVLFFQTMTANTMPDAANK